MQYRKGQQSEHHETNSGYKSNNVGWHFGTSFLGNELGYKGVCAVVSAFLYGSIPVLWNKLFMPAIPLHRFIKAMFYPPLLASIYTEVEKWQQGFVVLSPFFLYLAIALTVAALYNFLEYRGIASLAIADATLFLLMLPTVWLPMLLWSAIGWIALILGIGYFIILVKYRHLLICF